jgi:hypothetical protein
MEIRFKTICLLIVYAISLCGCASPEKQIEELPGGDAMLKPEAKELHDMVPASVGGDWELMGTGNYFGEDELGDYLFEDKDIYLFFGVSGLGVFRYSNGNSAEALYCEIYRLRNVNAAYALFTFFDKPEMERWDDALAGTRDEYGIAFCVAGYFVRISSMHNFWGAGAVHDELAYKITENTDDKGKLPDVCAGLPGENLVTGSMKFFTGGEQATFYFPIIADAGIFGDIKCGVKGHYLGTDTESCSLAVFGYKDETGGEAAFDDFKLWSEGQRSSAFYDIGVTYYFGAGPGGSVSLFTIVDKRLIIVYDYGREVEFAKEVLKAASGPIGDFYLAEISL